jgi:hypothetical protein
MDVGSTLSADLSTAARRPVRPDAPSDDVALILEKQRLLMEGPMQVLLFWLQLAVAVVSFVLLYTAGHVSLPWVVAVFAFYVYGSWRLDMDACHREARVARVECDLAARRN